MASLADILATTQQGVTAVNNLNGQFAKIGRPWTLYTPVVTAGSGTVAATGFGRFNQIGKTVFTQMTLVISSGAAGSNFILATLPVLPVASVNYVLAGRETNITGKMLFGILPFVGAQSVGILNYDNTYPSSGSSSVLVLSGVYEAA